MVCKAFCLIHYALHTKYCTHIVWHGSTNMLWLRNNHYYTLNDNFNVHNIIKTSCGFQPWLENWLKMIDSNEPSSSDGQTDQDCEQCRVKPISKNPDEWSDPLTGSNLIVLMFSKFTLQFLVRIFVHETIFGRRWYFKAQKPNATTQFFKHGWLNNLKLDRRAEIGRAKSSQLAKPFTTKH